MSLRERGAQYAPPTEKVCRVGEIRLSLDDDDRAYLDSCLPVESGWTHTSLAQLLTEEGHVVGETMVRKHRSGKCRCESR
jgi:hypothetical protein